MLLCVTLLMCVIICYCELFCLNVCHCVLPCVNVCNDVLLCVIFHYCVLFCVDVCHCVLLCEQQSHAETMCGQPVVWQRRRGRGGRDHHRQSGGGHRSVFRVRIIVNLWPYRPEVIWPFIWMWFFLLETSDETHSRDIRKVSDVLHLTSCLVASDT